jgi:hypothetical protein
VLDEALVHAAQNERPEAVAWLWGHGADPNAGPYQGCGALTAPRVDDGQGPGAAVGYVAAGIQKTCTAGGGARG